MSTQSTTIPTPVVNDNNSPEEEMNTNPENEAGDIETDQNDHDDIPPPPPPGEEEITAAKRLVEALLFASAEPLSERMLANRIPDGINVKSLLKDLQQEYSDRGVNLNRAGASWAFRTAEDLGAVLNIETEVARKMNRAGIETMAVIAYHQPVTRAEIEEIRGVSLSKGTLDLLFEKEWIKPRGRRETPGRPMTWGTTDMFLDHFGLNRLTDLPGLDELKAAGLLESGPALNIYRSRMNDEEKAESTEDSEENNPESLAPYASQNDEDALPEIDDTPEPDEPLDPDT